MEDKRAILILDDEGKKQKIVPKEEKVIESQLVAHKEGKVEEEQLVLQRVEKVEENIDALVETPDWLPDGWTMEVYRAENGATNEYYISPVSGFTFTMKSEVLAYLFSGVDERLLESKEEYAKHNLLQKSHQWLPKGWVIEVRAGGERMDKMYKFYVHTQIGVRLLSKEDVQLYIKEAKISKCDTKGECDTNSNDNILAKVELNPCGLPIGWVKEEVFRKTKEGGIRRDPYYTDHVSGYTFRTMKSALSYIETGNISKRAFIQTTSVHDIYSFDKSTDLPNTKICKVDFGCFIKILRDHLNQDKYRRESMRVTLALYFALCMLAEDGDSSTGSDSSYDPKEEHNKRCMKIAGKDSSKTAKPPRGRLQKFCSKCEAKGKRGAI
ncbi:hypothetical protein ACP70R_046727 [Stipagrostis hirtigluma subsp. patula]